MVDEYKVISKAIDRLLVELEETADWNKTVTVNRADLIKVLTSYKSLLDRERGF